MMMITRRARLSTALVLGIATLAATPAAAQSTLEDWLALRTRKQARHHRLPGPATHAGSLSITAIRFFSDSAGQLVVVGEARNQIGSHLTYSRLNFRFFDAGGAELGREWTYLHGGTNMRVVATGAFETALAPGETGFFKVWTQIPASAMASYTVETAGEGLALANPIAAGLVHADRWSPLRVVDQQVSALVVNSDWFGPGCPCGHPKVFASAIQLSVAAYQGGVIADVQSVIATGQTTAASCSTEPWATGLTYDQTARLTIDLAQPADSIGRHAIEWDEDQPAAGASPSILVFDESGGRQTFDVNRWCGSPPVVSEPWITIVDATGSGISRRVTIAVSPNAGTTLRRGTISLPGITATVVQTTACPRLPSTTIFLPATRVEGMPVGDAPDGCTFASLAQSTAPWLRAFVSSDEKLKLWAEPNTTGATRSGVVTWRGQSFTAHQSAAARNVDFNGDGRLDLLWHHRTGGWVAAWLMNGLQLSAGTLLSWSRVDDPNWTPAVVADLDRNGTTDIVWQNHANGSLALWRLTGTEVFRNDDVPSHVSPQWKLRGASDFNGDGDPDFVWQHDTTGAIELWYMRAGSRPEPFFGSWGSPSLLQTARLGPGAVADLDWRIVGTGDFNRDGFPDLVWQHEGDGRVAVWKMHGAALAEASVISPDRVPDPNWKIRAVGDLDGDDMPDLIWQHRTDGRIAAWVTNGTERLHGIVLAQLSDTQWEIVGPR